VVKDIVTGEILGTASDERMKKLALLLAITIMA